MRAAFLVDGCNAESAEGKAPLASPSHLIRLCSFRRPSVPAGGNIYCQSGWTDGHVAFPHCRKGERERGASKHCHLGMRGREITEPASHTIHLGYAFLSELQEPTVKPQPG